MAFRVVTGAAVWWPVTVDVPVDGGAVEQQTFELKFLRIGAERAVELSKMASADLLYAAALDWRNVLRDDEALLFSSAEDRAWLLDQPNVGEAIGQAWMRFLTAQPATRLGNSAPSAAGSPAPTAAETAEALGTPTP